MADRKSGVLLVGEPMALFMAQEEGEISDAKTFAMAVAGAELNVAIAMSRLGHRVSYLTKLGCDPFGKVIVRLMNESGISTEFTHFTSKRQTGIMFKSLTPGGDPSIYYMRKGSAASTLSPNDVCNLDVGGYAVLHMTGIMPALSKTSRAACTTLYEHARESGLLFSFDPNLRPQLWESRQAMVSFMNETAPKADLFLPGIAEARLLMGKDDATPAEAAAHYRAMGAKVVIVKCGAQGAYYDDGNHRGWGDRYVVPKVVDTVGAGDGFAAGILSAYIEGLSLHDAVSRGNAIGSLQIQVRGDNEGMPTRERLKEYQSTQRKKA